MIGILGKKLGMTQIFQEDGSVVPVTVIEAGPCSVLQVKTDDTDGYQAIQLGYGDKKESRVNKPAMGRFKKAKVKPAAFVKEIRTGSTEQYKVGQTLAVDIFDQGDFVDVTGITIGRGFQGGVKRWGWRGGRGSHGSMHHRAPGSVSASSFPSRVFKGHHMPGHMGSEKKTIQNMEVVKIDKENNILAVRGCVPGHKNSYLVIREARKHAKASKKEKVAEAKPK